MPAVEGEKSLQSNSNNRLSWMNSPQRARRFYPLALLAAIAVGCAAAPLPDPLPDPLAAGWQGKPVCERLHETGRQRILRCTFAPGIGHERHFHAPHFGYALAGGRMRITDENGERDAELESGTSFTSEGVAWHEVLNIGDTTAVFLIVESK